MFGDAWKLGAICITAQIAAVPAFADALPLKQTLKLGRPARPLPVELSAVGDKPALSVGGTAIALPFRGVTNASLESVAVADEANVAIVRATANDGAWFAIVGGKSGKELLIAERAELVGDPGEGHATTLQLESTDKEAVKRLWVGTRYEGFARCGDKAPPLLGRKQLNPKTWRMVPETGALEAPTNATTLPPQAATAPPTALHLLQASGSSQIDPLTRTPHVPHELTDDNAESSWQAKHGDTATLRWTAPGVPIEHFGLLVAAHDKPASLLLLLEGESYRVELPSAASAERVAVTPAKPVASGCVSLTLASGAPLAIAEFAAFSAYEAQDGLARLVSALVQDGDRAAEASELLVRYGEPAAVALAARYPELSPRGRRRALKVFARGLNVPEVRARVLEAARAEDETLSNAALMVLQQGGAPGVAGLRELALASSRVGDAAARALSLPRTEDLSALLAVLASPHGADRPVVRRALVTIARRSPDAFRDQSEAWLAAGPVLPARVGLSLVTAIAGFDSLALKLAESSLAAETFEDRFRLSLVAAELGPSATLDSWLAKQALEAAEWMQRRAAYDALRARDPALASKLAARIAKDAYPRVRAAAAPELSRAGKLEPLATLARKDPWPLVRAAAANGLGYVAESRPVLEELLEDTSRNVRAAAIDALGQQKSEQSWPLVERRLTGSKEWPVVQAAAVRFAAALWIQAARPQLAHAARRALRPDADDDDRRLGLEAIRALHDLGGEAAEDARRIASRESASPELMQAVDGFGTPRCTPEPKLATP